MWLINFFKKLILKIRANTAQIRALIDVQTVSRMSSTVRGKKHGAWGKWLKMRNFFTVCRLNWEEILLVLALGCPRKHNRLKNKGCVVFGFIYPQIYLQSSIPSLIKTVVKSTNVTSHKLTNIPYQNTNPLCMRTLQYSLLAKAKSYRTHNPIIFPN